VIIVGFTATRNITDAFPPGFVHETLSRLVDADIYVTGGARGGDAVIGRWLYLNRPHAHHIVVVPFNRSQVDEWWLEYPNADPSVWSDIEIRYMEEGTTYKDRNQALVNMCTHVVGFPEYSEWDERSRRSGSWQTLRMARNHTRHIKVQWFEGDKAHKMWETS